MTLTPDIIDQLADRLLAAQDHAAPIVQITGDYPDMTAADGYAVQEAVARRWTARGARIVGRKAGLTSLIKMRQIGLSTPSFGILSSAMALPEYGAVPVGAMIHPRIEAEIAFVMREPLNDENLTIDDVIAACDFVLPAIEIIDSRYINFKFDLPSVLADNSSSGRFAVGCRPISPRDIDLRTIGTVVEINGAVAATGASAAVLGHPAQAVALLVRHMAQRGEILPAGSLVLTGSMIEALPIAAGDIISARFQHLGSITLRCVG